MMESGLLHELVAEQVELLKRKENSLPREKLAEVSGKLKLKHSVVITGPRRCGKSTFLAQLMKQYYKPGDFYYFNFSDERLVGFQPTDFNSLLEAMIELQGTRKVFFFDEVQEMPNWEKFVNRLYEAGNKFILTGSNASLLSSELSTYLTGRHVDIGLFPFSFKEYLRYHGVGLGKGMNHTTKNRAAIKKRLNEYVTNGGFPEMVIYQDREILQRIYGDTVTKDVVVRYGIRDVATLEEIGLYLLSNTARATTYNKLKNVFGLGSVHTAKNYVSFLCNTFLFYEVEMFAYSAKKRMKFPKKIYSVDTGLVNALSFKASKDIGRLYENVVFVELKRRGKDVYYWKDASGKEVDFVVWEEGGVDNLIQVSYSLENEETREREIGALLSAMKHFKLKKALIITDNAEGIERYGKFEITLIPLWKWLLQ